MITSIMSKGKGNGSYSVGKGREEKCPIVQGRADTYSAYRVQYRVSIIIMSAFFYIESL